MPEPIVIGIDGGGTYTRAAASDLDGRVVGRAVCGGASPQHNAPETARDNVRLAIQGAIANAGRMPADVVQLVAGLAGLDEPDDEVWAAEFTRVAGLYCPRTHVNDAVVAHAGALLGRPGIVVISGTGSILFAVTEAGDRIRNYDLHHYARSAARHVGMDALFEILAERGEPEDSAFVDATLEFWHALDMTALRDLARHGCNLQGNAVVEVFGRFAQIVTDHAEGGSPLACRVCDRAAEAVCTGVRVLGSYFASVTVPVALVGGSVEAPYMRRAIAAGLDHPGERSFPVVLPALPAELGAVWMALEMAGTTGDSDVSGRLQESFAKPDAN